MSTKTKNVFISHVHKEDAGLTDIRNLLKNKGMEVRDHIILTGMTDEGTPIDQNAAMRTFYQAVS